VHTVNAGCDEGRVTWRYPHGGLRLSFATTYDDDDATSYDVCTIVGVTFCDVKLSLDGGDSLRLITVLTSTSSSLESVETCFQSSRGRPMSLYAESLPTVTSRLIGRLDVDYDVRRHVNMSRDMRGEPAYFLLRRLGSDCCMLFRGQLQWKKWHGPGFSIP